MYFPYLYGRGAELLAIRALLNDPRDRRSLVPILEPVNANIAALRRCIHDCDEKEQAVIVIFNAEKHQLQTLQERRRWQQDAQALFEEYPTALPAFRTSDRTTGAEITQFLAGFPRQEVALIHAGAGLSNREITRLAQNSRIRWHIILGDKIPDSQKSLLPADKKVSVQDGFRKLQRNADYAGTEFFTDRHRTFRENSAGFGDYLCLGASFQTGGTTPAAVAIHAIYKHPQRGDIWMEHFVSDQKNIGEGDVVGKFLQAATHLVRATRRRPLEFGHNQALDIYAAYVRTRDWAGLGKNKEHQIVHHICLMLDVLSGEV
jgi:hypothetical protein